MTKAELIQQIGAKIADAKPLVREHFMAGLERRSKAELSRILNKASVSADGYDIRLI